MMKFSLTPVHFTKRRKLFGPLWEPEYAHPGLKVLKKEHLSLTHGEKEPYFFFTINTVSDRLSYRPSTFMQNINEKG